MEEHKEYYEALGTIDKFIESLHDVDSPFEFAATMVRATAQKYNADIATLFRVTPSRTELIAEAGYDKKGQQLKARVIYNLKWDARKESDMKGAGLTAWVAVSGEPLFVKNADELFSHPAHKGAWDAELYPRNAAQTEFGCFYAVPLKIIGRGGQHLNPQESVVGVYKIERRKDNPEKVFNTQQIREFDLAAKQISLIILLYERAMLRILSDARHAVMGRLADANSQLDMLRFYLNPQKKLAKKKEAEPLAIVNRVSDDSARVYSWLRQSLQVYSNPTEFEHRTLKEFVSDTVEARSNYRHSIKIHIPSPAKEAPLRMTVAQSWDLHTLLLSLLNNAIQHSGKPKTVCLKAQISESKDIQTNESVMEYIFIVQDHGKGIPNEIIEDSHVKTVPQSLLAPSGTGLKRVFRVAKFRDWHVDHEQLNPGTKFKVTVTVREVK